jgi:hypothetical protein
MNLNHQIKPVPATLNVWRKLNEVIDTLNWIMSMYGDVSTDGNSQLQIIPGSRGPVFRMNVQSGNQQPWATDPDGNPAGWLKTVTLDPNDTTIGDEHWSWSGAVESNPALPWMKDPNGVQAQWVQHDVCVNGVVISKYFWGTP